MKDFVRAGDMLALSGFGTDTAFIGTTPTANGGWYSAFASRVTLVIADDGDGEAGFMVTLNGISERSAADLRTSRLIERAIDRSPFQDQGLWQVLNDGPLF